MQRLPKLTAIYVVVHAASDSRLFSTTTSSAATTSTTTSTTTTSAASWLRSSITFTFIRRWCGLLSYVTWRRGWLWLSGSKWEHRAWHWTRGVLPLVGDKLPDVAVQVLLPRAVETWRRQWCWRLCRQNLSHSCWLEQTVLKFLALAHLAVEHATRVWCIEPSSNKITACTVQTRLAVQLWNNKNSAQVFLLSSTKQTAL